MAAYLSDSRIDLQIAFTLHSFHALLQKAFLR